MTALVVAEEPCAEADIVGLRMYGWSTSFVRELNESIGLNFSELPWMETNQASGNEESLVGFLSDVVRQGSMQ